MNVKKFNRELNEVANILTNMKLNVGDITGLYEHIKKNIYNINFSKTMKNNKTQKPIIKTDVPNYVENENKQLYFPSGVKISDVYLKKSVKSFLNDDYPWFEIE